MDAQTCAWVYIYTHTHTCMGVHTHVCIHVCTYVQIIVSQRNYKISNKRFALIFYSSTHWFYIYFLKTLELSINTNIQIKIFKFNCLYL